MRKKSREAHRQLREYGHSDTVISVLDLARQLSDRTRDLAPLLRALAVEPVHIRLLAPNGTLGYSTDGQRRYVHAFTSVPRLAASMDVEDEQLSMQQVPLPQLAAQLPEGTGVLLDVGSPMQRPIEPEHLREIRAMAAGIATRCCHPGQGDGPAGRRGRPRLAGVLPGRRDDVRGRGLGHQGPGGPVRTRRPRREQRLTTRHADRRPEPGRPARQPAVTC